MKFLCDEGVDRPIVEALRAAGHNVAYVAEQSAGVEDEELLQAASREDRADKDFGELVFRQGRLHSGVVLLRLHGLGPSEKAQITVVAIGEHGSELKQSFPVLPPRAPEYTAPKACRRVAEWIESRGAWPRRARWRRVANLRTLSEMTARSC